ncbi:hypothetical protein FA95DRAFT_1671580 [Auriscalpium vulgare]|uniref:Uncharacterized protein n=1 Tax=Auriscalpium vulgare TaxID=40419 RepID=A0ACB8RPB8_9AGAM|nr:hypothetical protein FA95DRAFT_1671580 [Auriscalpium vulgare]
MGDPAVAALATQLIDLSAAATDPEWRNVESAAQALATALRVRDPNVDNQSELGKTGLPAALTAILKSAAVDTRKTDAIRLAAVFEVLRVGANLCMDHDVNRGLLLEARFPQTIVSILEGYVDLIPADRASQLLPLSIPHLKVAKTSIGVLLNATVGYDQVKLRLISLEAAVIILKLTSALYPAGAWLTQSDQGLVPEQDQPLSPEDVEEQWNLRSGLSAWAWRTIEELKDDSRSLFGQDALPLLIPPLRMYLPPHAAPTGISTGLRHTLLTADFDTFEESCTLVESLALDVEDVRLSLARGMAFPDEHGGVQCLQEIMRFIDKGDYHPLWAAEPQGWRAKREKTFDNCKAALIKSVVEVAGEERNVEVLWDESDQEHPGGAFVSQMVYWIKSQKDLKTSSRDDLLVCATLSLGNLLRHESHSAIIVSPPISLGPDLASILDPAADLKVKHGVIGLLRHLAYAVSARAPLADAKIIQRLVASQIFHDTSDIAELVQVNAIGIAKHLCNGNSESCFAFTLSAGDDAPTGLDQILALVNRSDTVAVKSEGTRVFVNVIRTLWSSATPESKQRTQAMEAICKVQVTLALAQLIGRSKRYAVLVNEGIVALALLSLHPGGGTCTPLLTARSHPDCPPADTVLDALTTPLPKEAAPPNPGADDVASPVVGPGRALDMLLYVLRAPGPHFREEVRANVYALFGQVGREGGVGAARAPELARFKGEVRPLLEDAAKGEAGKLQVAASGALQRWGK